MLVGSIFCENICSQGPIDISCSIRNRLPPSPVIAAQINKGEKDVSHEIVADEAQRDLPEQRAVELGVQDVGEEGEEEEEGGHEERGGVEGVGELLPVPAQPLRQAEPEAHLQVRLLQPGGVDLRGRGASRELMMGEGNKQPLLC